MPCAAIASRIPDNRSLARSLDAVIPAIIYYLSVGLIVYFRAVKDQLHGVPESELPSWMDIIPKLHLLLPIPAMVFFLVAGDSPFLAAAKTIVLILTNDLIWWPSFGAILWIALRRREAVQTP